MKPHHTPDQIDLMLRAVERAKREPDLFDMKDWAQDALYCGTVCCYAGNICLEAGYQINYKSYSAISPKRQLHIQDAAEAEIGLDGDNDGSILWVVAYWPQPFQDQYNLAATPLDRALALEGRVRHYLETGE